MTVLKRDSTNASNPSNTTLTINMPTVVEGDLLVLKVFKDAGASNRPDVPDPDTWALAGELVGDTTHAQYTYIRVATDSEPASLDIGNMGNSATNHGAAILETWYDDVGGGSWGWTSTGVVDNYQAAATPNNLTVGPLTSIDNCVMLMEFSAGGTATLNTAPSGMTLSDSNGDGDYEFYAYYEAITTGGTENRTIEFSTDTALGFLYFIYYNPGPYLVGSTKATNPSSTTLTIDRPGDTLEGDFMVISLLEDGNGSPVGPAGWDLLVDEDPQTQFKERSWSKVAGASEPANYTITGMGSNASQFGHATLTSWRHDSAGTWNISATYAWNFQANTSPNSITIGPHTPAANSVLINQSLNDGIGSYDKSPDGMLRAEFETTGAGRIYVNYQPIITSAAESRTIEFSSDDVQGSLYSIEFTASGGSTITGSGNAQATDSVVAGVATRIVTGSGNAQASDSVVTGAGEIFGVVTGTGNAQATDSVVAGVATRIVTGSGNAQASDSVVAGAGGKIVTIESVTTIRNQENFTITVTGAEDVQNSGFVTFGGITCAIVSWSNGTIVATCPNAEVTSLKYGNQTLVVQNNSGESANSIEVWNPATDNDYEDIVSLGPIEDRITALPDLEAGDQVRHEAFLQQGASQTPYTVTVNDDATWEAGNGPIPNGTYEFEVRAWDTNDQTWGTPADQIVIIQGVITGSGNAQASDSAVAGNATRIVTGSGNAQASDSVVNGSADVFTVITGSGNAQASDSIVAGNATRILTAIGNAIASDSTVAGNGDIFTVVTGSGNAQASDSVVNGLGTVGNIILGAGNAQASDSVVAGSATRIITGSGNAQATDCDVSGNATRILTGTGNAIASDSVVAGTGSSGAVITGSGNVQASDSTVAGSATRIITGSGNAQATDSVVSGLGTIGNIVLGTGNAQATDSVVAGVGDIFGIITGSGNAQASDSVVSGVELPDVDTPARRRGGPTGLSRRTGPST